MTIRVIWNGKHDKAIEGTILPFKKEVSLFRSDRKWWLAYTDKIEHNTGHFKTKKKAIEWYKNGGR